MRLASSEGARGSGGLPSCNVRQREGTYTLHTPRSHYLVLPLRPHTGARRGPFTVQAIPLKLQQQGRCLSSTLATTLLSPFPSLPQPGFQKDFVPAVPALSTESFVGVQHSASAPFTRNCETYLNSTKPLALTRTRWVAVNHTPLSNTY